MIASDRMVKKNGEGARSPPVREFRGIREMTSRSLSLPLKNGFYQPRICMTLCERVFAWASIAPPAWFRIWFFT